MVVSGTISDPGIGAAPIPVAVAAADKIHLLAVDDFALMLFANSMSLFSFLRMSYIAFRSLSMCSPVFEDIGTTL